MLKQLLNCRSRVGFDLLVTVAFVIGTTTVALPQAYYCYRESGSTVQLTVQDSIISVKLQESKLSWQGLFLSEPALDSTIPPESVCEDFALLRVAPGSDPVALVERLRNRTDVLFANLSFLDAYANPIYLTESFVANFYPSVSQIEIDSMNSAHGVIVLDSLFDDPTWLLLKLTAASDLDVLAMGNCYHQSAIVRYAKAGMMLNLHLDADPYDEYWYWQWHFNNLGQTGGVYDADINLDLVWDYHEPDPFDSIIVGILDDGFAPHEDFPASRIIGGWDYYYNRPDYKPGIRQYHGMGAMGIIGACIDGLSDPSSESVAGMTEQVYIIGQKIYDDDGSASALDIKLAKAVSDAVLAGAQIINISSSCETCGQGAGYDSTCWWIRKADSLGVTIVCSAGNHARMYPGVVGWPANMPEAIAIGATDSSDTRWYYSAYGPELDVVAPSGDIPHGKFAHELIYGHFWTLDQMDTLGLNNGWFPCMDSNANYNCGFGGTSAAAPQVTGIVALMMLHRPEIIGQTDLIKWNVEHTAEDRGDPGWDQYYGWGRLNADQAVLTVVRGDADNNGVVDIADAVYLEQYIFVPGSPPPMPREGTGDANCDGTIDISDMVYIVQYIFVGGPAPYAACWFFNH